MASDGTGGGGALINFDGLSKVGNALIEKISDAIGGLAKPWQMVRVAKAEAQVEMIRSQAKIAISETEERAILRMVREEGKRQENIESITAKAIPELSPEAKPETLENDWLVYFFDRCRLVSDDEMQTIWSKILAGEANKPKSFSRRTVDLVATLDKADAELFTNFCTFLWTASGSVPMIFDVNDQIFKNFGINFMSLTHLDDIGLISFSNIMTFSRLSLPRRAMLSYYGQHVIIEFPDDQNNLGTGHALLTRAGQELANICSSTPSEEYFQYVLKRWSNKNYILSMSLAARPLAVS